MIAAERRAKAVEMRKLGFTYQKIGDELGVSLAGAHKTVMTALKQLNEQTAEGAEEIRRLELERLDEWLVRVAKEIQNGRALPAIDRGIRIMDRRAKLLGLDAPTKLEVRDLYEVMFQELKVAAQEGDTAAAEAIRKIADGHSFLAAGLEWTRETRRVPLVSDRDISKMKHEELVKAATGRLQPDDLKQIRKRPEAAT